MHVPGWRILFGVRIAGRTRGLDAPPPTSTGQNVYKLCIQYTCALRVRIVSLRNQVAY